MSKERIRRIISLFWRLRIEREHSQSTPIKSNLNHIISGHVTFSQSDVSKSVL